MISRLQEDLEDHNNVVCDLRVQLAESQQQASSFNKNSRIKNSEDGEKRDTHTARHFEDRMGRLTSPVTVELRARLDESLELDILDCDRSFKNQGSRR